MSSSSNNNMEDVEEGVPVPVPIAAADDDQKSDAGSATTAPSVESGEHAENKEATAAVAPKSRRRWLLIGGGVAVVVVIGVVLAVVFGSCDKNKNKNKSTTAISAEEAISLGPDDEAPPMYPSDKPKPPPPHINFDAPFGEIELPLFEEDVLETYASRKALEDDLTLAAKDMINKVILQNLKYSSDYHHGMVGGHPVPAEPMMGVLEDVALEAGVGASMASAAGKQSSQKKVLNSMTNNQEKDVDEADVLKTDGNLVYAAYGDYLVVWDLQGNMLTSEKMPVPQEEEDDMPQEELEENTEAPEDMFFYEHSMAYAYIESIQLTENHIVLAVGGLGHYQDKDIGYGTKGTHLRVYNKPTTSVTTLELVATRDIHGYYFGSRYLEESNSIQIVTGGDFSTFSGLVEPLDVYHFAGLNQTEYYYAARLLAENELIPNFVTRVTDFFLEGNEGQMPALLKVNSWMTAAQRQAKQDAGEVIHPEDHFYGSYDEAFRAYMQVTSIPAGTLPTTPVKSLAASTTAVVGPSSWGYMYATQDNLVLHMARYDWNHETEHSEETLFVIHLKVAFDTAETTFHSMASLPGYLPNVKSVDIQGDDLRIATIHQKWMPLENVWPICGDSWYFEDTCMDETNWNDCFDTALNCRNVVKTGCPYTFECEDDEDGNGAVESSTDNFVYVFDISQPGQMMEHGHVRIGEPHEVIMGVHFGETFSYANTFDQRDPFYVLNLPAGQAPTIAGELKLEGFSSYLQPVNDDATLVVGIGQNVTGEGMDQAPNGLLVTVFDVSDPSAPKALASDMLANPKTVDSYSDAEWDSKAVQYNDGLLVIPLSLYQKYHSSNTDDAIWNGDGMVMAEEENVNGVMPMEPMMMMDESKNFEGFIVLDVSEVAAQGIKEVARISHTKSNNNNNNDVGCNYCSTSYIAYRRSFLFDDKSLMTVHDSAVINTDLTTGNTLWSFNVTLGGEEINCCH